MTDIKHCVLGEIEGENVLLLFRSDEEAAYWAMVPNGQKRRLWEASVRIGHELLPVPPGPPSLRVANRTEALVNRVDTPEGPA